MAEVWIRQLSNKRTLDKAHAELLLTAVDFACGTADPHRSSVIRPTPDQYEDIPVVNVAEMVAELSDLPAARSRNLMVVLWANLCTEYGSDPCEWVANHIARLCLHFPEILFRIVIIVDDKTLMCDADGFVVKDEGEFGNWSLWDISSGLAAEVYRFAKGYREWFDQEATRRRVRDKAWAAADGAPVAESEVLPRAIILEDEREYSELLAYAAFRSGAYLAEIVNSEALYKDRIKAATANNEEFLVVHALDLPFSPFDGLSPDERYNAWGTLVDAAVVPGAAWAYGWRMVVTASSVKQITIVSPRDWDQEGDRFAWRFQPSELPGAADRRETLRGLKKPLPWLHGLRASGLFPMWSDCCPQQMFELRERDPDAAEGGHSPPAVIQEIAEFLLNRARDGVKQYLPTIAAVQALDAMRILRGYSSSLFLDALTLLYQAEVAIELDAGSTGAGNPTRETKERVREHCEILEFLESDKCRVRLPEGIAYANRERVWSELRQQYMAVGCFDAAEEALMAIHGARAGRIKSEWRTAIAKPLRWRSLRIRGHQWWKVAGRLCRHRLCRHIWRAVSYATPAGLSVYAKCASPKAWSSSTSLHEHPWPVAGSVLAVLVVAVFNPFSEAGWVGAAVKLRRWLSTTLLCVLWLAWGNLMVLTNTPKNQPHASVSAAVSQYADATLWTCGHALGSEMLPRVMHATEKGDSSASTVCFDLALSGQSTSHYNRAQSLMWMENVVTAWALFAFGLSVIYRQAVRN